MTIIDSPVALSKKDPAEHAIESLLHQITEKQKYKVGIHNEE